jgi:2-polyprenyl-3-methyl-5-hydroxy-6-metoxy-1,4-benzoquinol methylase
MPSNLSLSPLRHVASAEDCDFYHSLNIPGIGEVKGQWDLRGGERNYTGSVDLNGKNVLEVGPASGYMTFWMERQGAKLTCLDLSEDHKWDFVPFQDVDIDAHNSARKTHLQRLHNSWWFTRNLFGSKADVAYGTIYDLDKSLGDFDVVTLGSILLHLRDPFGAISKAASVAKDTIIITDVAEEQFFSKKPHMWAEKALYFIPRMEEKSIDAWFFIPSDIIKEFLLILGFKEVSVTKHTQNFMTAPWKFYTVVGKR